MVILVIIKVDLKRIDRHGVLPGEPGDHDDDGRNGETQYCAEETSLKRDKIKIKIWMRARFGIAIAVAIMFATMVTNDGLFCTIDLDEMGEDKN